MDTSVDINQADLSQYSMDRLQRELMAIQMSLEMLYTKNNSLEHVDLSDGGGSAEDQAEYQRLQAASKKIVSEINKRHTLDVIDGKAETVFVERAEETHATMPESINGPSMDLSSVVAPPSEG